MKSNIGHLEGAAGVAGLIKAIMVLEKGVIPPNINFERPNPKILVDKWNIKVGQTLPDFLLFTDYLCSTVSTSTNAMAY